MDAHNEREAVTRLSELLDGIEERVAHGTRVASLDERNRLTLLFGHAVFGIMVAPGFALLYKSGMTSPSLIFAREIPGSPISLAVWILAGGIGLAFATLHRNRRWEFAFLGVMLLWYLMFSVSLMAAVAAWLTAAILAGGLADTIGNLDWSHAPALYAPVVYGHLAYAMAGHMWTIWKLGLRPEHREHR